MICDLNGVEIKIIYEEGKKLNEDIYLGSESCVEKDTGC